jgi:ABC-type cobalt transport system substrate-binding protein
MRRRALAALLLAVSQLAPAAAVAREQATMAATTAEVSPTAAEPPARWAGVDEAVIEKIAAEAGRTARPLWFELEGDLALFLFLCAGIAGGSVLGYCFRMIFVERIDEKPGHESRAH